MEEYKNIGKKLQQMLDKAEELDWSYSAYVEPSQNNRTYAEMGKPSPAGEDFSMVIDFDAEDQAESFVKDLRDYADNFDVDGHVEMWLPERGKGGCLSTVRELVEDAEAIVEMIKELYEELDGVLHAELAANMMVDRRYKQRFPAIVTEEDSFQYIEEYYEPDQEGSESENG